MLLQFNLANLALLVYLNMETMLGMPVQMSMPNVCAKTAIHYVYDVWFCVMDMP